MARIVKAFSVVDDRQHKQDAMAQLEANLTERKVLKGNVLTGYGFTFKDHNAPVNRDELLDEINRLKVQQEEAKATLRAVEQEIAEAREELEEIEASKENADIVDDEVYRQRSEEIEAMVTEARQKAQELLEEAEADGKVIREHSRAEGYEEGYTSGYAVAEKAFREEGQAKLQELAELITSLSAYGPELIAQREAEFVQLAVAVASKVVARELKTKPATILDMLRDILLKNRRETYINITISPDLLPAQAKACSEVLEKLQGIGPNITVYVEKDAEPGTLLMETSGGVTDMSPDTQLENLQELLLAPDIE